MPFARPTPQDIRDRISADVVRTLKGTAALMRRSLEWVLVRMVAVAAHELHGHLAWISRQVLVDRADDEELERHAGIWGIARRPAVAARGPVTFAGTPGATIPAETELRRSDDVRYLTDAAVAIPASGTVLANVTAAVAGDAGNAPAGTVLSLVSPIAGVQGRVPVGAQAITGSVAVEDDPSLRARVLRRIQEPPHGGARHDYPAWVAAVTGETRVWVFPLRLGPGTVSVYFTMPDGSMPPAATVAAVHANVDTQRPVTAEVFVMAPIVMPLNFSIRLRPDTETIRARVAAELKDFLIREAEPGGTLRFSRLSAAISAVVGEDSHDLIAPAASVTPPFGSILRLGAIGWVV